MTSLPFAPETFGITRLAEQGSLLSVSVPVWSAIRPSAKSFAVTNGKGHSHEQAQLSAAMEAVECACAEASGRLIERWASIEDLISEGAPMIDLGAVLSVHAETLDRSRIRGWVRGVDITTGTDVLAPYETVGLDYRVTAGWDRENILMSSAGLAAHTDARAATLHALQELIEQEASLFLTTIRGYSRNRTRLDPVKALPQRCKGVLRDLSASGGWVELIDTTTDIGVPIVMAILHEGASGAALRHHAAGCACRLDISCAAEAALFEALQSRATDFAGTRDDIVPGDYALRGARRPKPHRFGQPPAARQTGDPLQAVQSRLAKAGLACIYRFDLSPPDSRIVCHKLIVPGLECLVDGARPPRRGRRYKTRGLRSLL